MSTTHLFTAEELKRIETAVTEAEKHTSGEILTMVVPASSDYRWIRWFWAAVGTGIASFLLVLADYRTEWVFSVFEMLECQLLGALIGTCVAHFRPFQRLVMSQKQSAWRVHREALANFTASGLHETHDRTGVLIYISELEQRVQILADTGIHGKAGEPYWNDLVTEIVGGVKKGRATDAIVSAIGRMGTMLAEHFPPRADAKHEISNEVRLKPSDL